MLYYQGFTLSKIQEAENMGKKTVPIAVQRTQKRKVFITSNDKDIDADPAEDSFKIIPIKNG
jgi:hypothetical protein